MRSPHPAPNLYITLIAALGALLTWGVTSVAFGLMRRRTDKRWQRGFARQFVWWGLIDTLLATSALPRLLRKARRYTWGALGDDEVARDLRFFERLLWVNSGLDLFYVSGGVWVARRSPDELARQGAGWGAATQGAFLLMFDSLTAAALRRCNGGPA